MPLLTPAEQDALIAAYRERGDVAARNALVVDAMERYARVIGGVARRTFGRRLADLPELGQEAAILAMEAIDRYDPARGIPFGPWALQLLRVELSRRGRESLSPTPLAKRQVYRLVAMHKVRMRLEREGRPCGPEDVLDAMRAKTGSRGEYLAIQAMSDRSRWVEWTCAAWGAAGCREPGPAERAEVKDAAAAVLAGFAGRDAAIVRAYFGIGRPAGTTAEVAAEFGCSRSTICNVLARCGIKPDGLSRCRPGTWRCPDDGRVRELAERGGWRALGFRPPIGDIAAAAGMTKAKVAGALKRLGLDDLRRRGKRKVVAA